MNAFTIRFAEAADVDTILALIQELADFEREPDAVKTTREDLLRDGFGEQVRFECFLAEREGETLGFLLFFPTYSTWTGRLGIHLEDLYVRPDFRGQGVGKALLARSAALLRERGGVRLELNVLDWNTSAAEVYAHLGFKRSAEWFGYRMEGPAVDALASG